jgi:hypothetical protein
MLHYLAKLYFRNEAIPKSFWHPKLIKLEEIILDHFKNWEKGNIFLI